MLSDISDIENLFKHSGLSCLFKNAKVLWFIICILYLHIVSPEFTRKLVVEAIT